MTDGKVVVVTGAARGIGLAVAERLAGKGWTVVGLDRDGETLETRMASLRGTGHAVATDLVEHAEVEKAISGIADKFGRIDALVNCAGITGKTGVKAHEVDPDDFDLVYRINLYAAMLLTRAVVPVMLRNGYGRILHAYSATKSGLIGLVKSAAKDYAETGITINALAPAVIRTDLVAAMPEAQVKYMTDKIPMKRTGELEEAAAMIEFIVSPECAFTTGFTFDLSGGRATY